jgi:hypothetical protein
LANDLLDLRQLELEKPPSQYVSPSFLPQPFFRPVPPQHAITLAGWLARRARFSPLTDAAALGVMPPICACICPIPLDFGLQEHLTLNILALDPANIYYILYFDNRPIDVFFICLI